ESVGRRTHGIGVRQGLSKWGAPRLGLPRPGAPSVSWDPARYLARHIKEAKYVEFPSPDHLPWVGDSNSILGEIESFLTGQRREIDTESDRVLATILFTDIVGATNRLVELGDRGWKDLLNQHHSLVRDQLARHRGGAVASVVEIVR